MYAKCEKYKKPRLKLKMTRRCYVNDEFFQQQQQQLGGDADAGPFSSPSSVLKDPPLGEGWDEHGNDLSKAANDVSTRYMYACYLVCVHACLYE